LTPLSAPNAPTPRLDVSHAPNDFREVRFDVDVFGTETPLDKRAFSSPASEVSIGDVPSLGVDGEEAAASHGTESASATTSA
jgi:hypothetical protein